MGSRQAQIRGDVIRWARIRLGLTLRDVEVATAKAGCKVDSSNLSRAENGKPGLGLNKIPVLAEILSLTPEQITGLAPVPGMTMPPVTEKGKQVLFAMAKSLGFKVEDMKMPSAAGTAKGTENTPILRKSRRTL